MGSRARAWLDPPRRPRPSTDADKARRRRPGLGHGPRRGLAAVGRARLGWHRARARARPAPSTGRAGRRPVGSRARPTAVTQPVTIDESSAVIDAAAKVGPAVVQIYTVGRRPDDPRRVPSRGRRLRASSTTPTAGSSPTGTWSPAATELTVELKDGRKFHGHVYGIDTLTDLAIVKVDATGLPTAPIGDSDGLKVGQLVDRDRQPARDLLEHGHQRHRLGARARRSRSTAATDPKPDPDRRGDQPRQQRRAAARRRAAPSSASTPRSPRTRPASASRSRSTSPGRSWSQALAGEALARPWIGIRYRPIDAQLPRQQACRSTTARSSDRDRAATATRRSRPTARPPAAGSRTATSSSRSRARRSTREHPLDALLTQFAPGDTVTLKVLRDGRTVTIDGHARDAARTRSLVAAAPVRPGQPAQPVERRRRISTPA